MSILKIYPTVTKQAMTILELMMTMDSIHLWLVKVLKFQMMEVNPLDQIKEEKYNIRSIRVEATEKERHYPYLMSKLRKGKRK